MRLLEFGILHHFTHAKYTEQLAFTEEKRPLALPILKAVPGPSTLAFHTLTDKSARRQVDSLVREQRRGEEEEGVIIWML